MVDFTASLAHFADHMAPVWRALAPEHRGRFFVPADLVAHVEALGVEPTVYQGRGPRWADGGPVVVAATRDYRRALSSRRPIVYMAHGCGQAFNALDGRPHRSYAGGAGRGQVALFLAVNEYQAARWRRAYPATPCAVIGCPKLDGLTREDGVREGPVCITFHWPCQAVPEAGNAWAHYRDGLADLAAQFDLVAHAHPHAWVARAQLTALGVPFLDRFEDVLTTASVLVNDCSSILFEFAAVRGPVVVMNAPWFRRGATHGGRFWEWASVGHQVDHPRDLAAAIRAAAADPPDQRAARRRVVREVYPVLDAAAAAATAICELAGLTNPICVA